MFVAAFQPVAQIPAEVAAKAGITLVESGVLGALLVVSVLANVALVWLAFRTMNKRVEDTKKIADLTEKMVTTFAEVNGTLDNMEQSDKTQAAALQGLASTMNSILLSMLTRANVPHPLPPPHGHNGPTGGGL